MKTRQTTQTDPRPPRRNLGIFGVAVLFALGIWGLSGFGNEEPQVTTFQPSQAASVTHSMEPGESGVRPPESLAGGDGPTNGPVRYPDGGENTKDWQPDTPPLSSSPSATTEQPDVETPVPKDREREQ